MPIRTLTPQSDVQDRLSLRLHHMSTTERGQASTLGGASADVLGLAAPHPVFNLSLQAIDRDDWVSAVKMTGWRYFVTSSQGVVATAEARALWKDGPVEGTLTNEGPFVVGSEQALALAERLPEIAGGKYVLGLLRVPPLYVVALWLRSEQGPEGLDRFVPVSPAPAPFRTDSALRPEEFITILRRLKAERLDSAGGSAETTN